MGKKYVCDVHGEVGHGWIDGEGKRYCPECLSLLKEQPKNRYVVYTKEDYARYFFTEFIKADYITDTNINHMNEVWERISKGHSFAIRDIENKDSFYSVEYFDKMYGINIGSNVVTIFMDEDFSKGIEELTSKLKSYLEGQTSLDNALRGFAKAMKDNARNRVVTIKNKPVGIEKIEGIKIIE